MANNRPKATDYTGRQREALAKEFAEEQSKRAGEMSLATAEAQFKAENEVIDATKPNRLTTIVVDEVKTTGAVGNDTVVIRVTDDIENMTLGAGTSYTFKVGNKYSVTKDVAAHLQEKGYVLRFSKRTIRRGSGRYL